MAKKYQKDQDSDKEIRQNRPAPLPKEWRDDIREAINVMNQGGVILYPTDTIWGIGCDATNEEAVRKVYEIDRKSVV